MLTVACVNVGTKYGVEYVHILHAMVGRHLKQPFRFICFTDDPSRYVNAPFEARKEASGLHGWWAKIGLFNRANGLTGRVFYLDLDVVIVRELDSLVAECSDDFWIIRDWMDGMYNSSVMLFTAEEQYGLYEQFNWRDQGVYKTDQHFIYYKYGKCQLLDPQQVQSYKADACEEAFGDQARIVVFHGYPKPPDCGGWVKDYWK